LITVCFHKTAPCHGFNFLVIKKLYLNEQSFSNILVRNAG